MALFGILGLILLFLASFTGASNQILEGVTVLTTAPPSYAPRLRKHLEEAGATVVACPTVDTQFLTDPEEKANLQRIIDTISKHTTTLLSPLVVESRLCCSREPRVSLNRFLRSIQSHGFGSRCRGTGFSGCRFLVDPHSRYSESARNCLSFGILDRTRVQALCVLCPVLKVDQTEPSAVPDFLASLQSLGLSSVHRVNAYVARWTGLTSTTEEALRLLRLREISAIAISSTAEVEGLQLLLASDGVDCCLKHVNVAAHGPVTARGARALGLPVHAISEDSSSFAGMVDTVSKCIQEE
jgi:uroporphyrinogen-III synthase